MMKKQQQQQQSPQRLQYRPQPPASRAAHRFTRSGWNKQAQSALLAATEAIDGMCRAIVHTRSVSRGVSKEVRNMGLTVAVFERSLFAYAEKLARHSDSSRNRRRRRRGVGGGGGGDSSIGGTLRVPVPLIAMTSMTDQEETTDGEDGNMIHATKAAASLKASPVQKPLPSPLLSRSQSYPYDTSMVVSNSNSMNNLPVQSPVTDASVEVGLTTIVSNVTAPTTTATTTPTVPSSSNLQQPDAGTTTPQSHRSHSSHHHNHHHRNHHHHHHRHTNSQPILPPTPSPPSPPPPPPPPPSNKQARVHEWHVPGGVVALLDLLTNTLDETRTTLLECKKSASFLAWLRVNFGNWRGWSATGVVSVLLFVFRRHTHEFRSRWWSYVSSSVYSMIPDTFTTIASVMVSSVQRSRRYARLMAFFVRIGFNRTPWWLRGTLMYMLTILSLLYTMYRRHTQQQLHRLRSLHTRLTFLQRLWHVCVYVMDDREKAVASRQFSNAVVPISMWMLQLVPTNLSASFWYHSSWHLRLLKYWMDVLYSTVSVWYSVGLHVAGLPITFGALVYYTLRPSRAAKRASQLLAAPDIRLMTAVWQVFNTVPLRWLSKLLYRPLAVHQDFYLSERVDSEFTELDLDDDDDDDDDDDNDDGTDGGGGGSRHGGANSANYNSDENSMALVAMMNSGSESGGGAGGAGTGGRRSVNGTAKSSVVSPKIHGARVGGIVASSSGSITRGNSSGFLPRRSLKKEDHPIHISILCAKKLSFYVNPKLRRNPSMAHLPSSLPPPRIASLSRSTTPLVVYLHGGGWVASLSLSDMQVLTRWAESTEVPFVHVDYSLAPEHGYPTALDECFAVYKWAAEGRLGFIPSNIVVVGDSAGGHLAVGLCMRAIMQGVRVPDGLVMAYPVLNLDVTPTTSRHIFMMDPIAPRNLLKQCISVYVPSHIDVVNDPCTSPLLAPDELWKKFPPTSILTGDYDPFLDDSVDVAHRLYDNGVPCRLRVLHSLPHQFLSFQLLLPAAKEGMMLIAQWLKDYCKVN